MAWLIFWLTFLLFGIMFGVVGSPVTVTLLRVPIDTSTLRFSVSSFLALFGSSLFHLFMDFEEVDEWLSYRLFRKERND